MAIPGDEFRETWIVSDTKVTAGGDTSIIKDFLATKLVKIRIDWRGWFTLYRHCDSRLFWELSYPNAEMHGGGPKLLRCLDINDPDEWKTPARPENW